MSDGSYPLDGATLEVRMTYLPKTLGILGNDLLDVDKPTFMAHIILCTMLSTMLVDVTLCTTIISQQTYQKPRSFIDSLCRVK